MSNTIDTTSERVGRDSERSCERQTRDGEEGTGEHARALIAVALFFLFFLLLLLFFSQRSRIQELTILIGLPQYHVPEACRDRGQWWSRM